ncbi:MULTISPECIES: restriction endonuclease [unclassified Endozoicomonas]|uniref:restriction endonuclease n=1 Tax=unclassified Endozoicomonas TaxID=2644528 RepID=UPI003BB70DC9
MNNENTEYEKLAQEIYQAINEQHETKNISVQHNVKLEGKSGCNHQIDVYWEFESMGETHRVAIECKNYTSEVSVGKIRDFFGVLHDIGNIKGIFITKKGFQSGAKKFAEYYGISLKEMRFPNESDWEGRAKTIVFNISALTKRVTERRVIPDQKWAKENGFDLTQQVSGMSDDLKIVSASGEVMHTMHELENELPHDGVRASGLSHSYRFPDAFLTSPSGLKLKIHGIDYIYDALVSDEQMTIEGEAIAKAILKDVKSDKYFFYNKSNEVYDVG